MGVGPRRYKGKFKGQIAEEAFVALGPNATRQEVNAYFKKNYGIPQIEEKMFWRYRKAAKNNGYTKSTTNGISPEPIMPPATIQKAKMKKIWNYLLPKLISQVRQLADEMGGYEEPEELITAFK